MKDFRPELRPPIRDKSHVEDLLAANRFVQALKAARALGLALTDLRGPVDSAAQRMFLGHGSGELLTAIEQFGIALPFSTEQLLRRLHVQRDYHTFLKHAERTGVPPGMDSEVEVAIDAVAQAAPTEAAAWRRKLSMR